MLQRRGNEQFKCGSAEMHGFRMSMEDCHTIAPKLSEKHPKIGLFAVFDGHAGDRAAIYLEAELRKRVAALEDPTDETQLSECVQKLDADFLTDEAAREDGSTCTFCVVHPVDEAKGEYEVIACNVGDSRSIIIRANGDMVGLTNDHKPEDPQEDARIRSAGGSVSMNRVDGQLAMSRAIGDWQYKSNPNLTPELQKVIAVPEIIKGKMYKGDHLLICCDGIVEQMSSEDAAAFAYRTLAKQRSSDSGNDDLARVSWELNRYSLERGSKDNHSCMVIALEDGCAYQGSDEFVPGPFTPFKKDQAFRDAYLADAKKHGYEGEELLELIRREEAGMPELANMAPDDDMGSGGGGGGEAPIMGLEALHALMNRPGDANEKWMMISNMLSQRGGGGGGEEDGDGDSEK